MNTAYLFDTALIDEMKLSGLSVSPSQWGWGDHYIWRLFAGVVVTALVGLLSGAIAKKGGARIAAIANIPSVFIWSGLIYLLGLADVEFELKTAFILISAVAIPITTYVAYLSGGIGEKIQRERFPGDTVLGIKGYHWAWIIFPLYLYALGIVYAMTKLILLTLENIWSANILTSILVLFMSLPIVAWIFPLLIVCRVLAGDLVSGHSALVRGMTNLGVLTFGMLVAGAVQFGVS